MPIAFTKIVIFQNFNFINSLAIYRTEREAQITPKKHNMLQNRKYTLNLINFISISKNMNFIIRRRYATSHILSANEKLTLKFQVNLRISLFSRVQVKKS